MMKKRPCWEQARTLFYAIVIAALTACSSTKTIDIKAEGSPSLNRDAKGKPLSVVVHVYQLKNQQAFNRLTMEALSSGKPESELLGDSLISSKELTFLPGGKVTLEDVTIEKDAQFIGVVGFFRRPDAHFWRLLYDADAVRSKDLSFRAADCHLEAIKPKALTMPGQPSPAKADCAASRN
ncbi:type VI secretion system lipoprotein TssJ [Chromobacterium haemolyticum]|uniref:Type VI secretion system-associated lipoprotein n=1 Tax=Chromobacterium haemolyticum TaxID=394935 RepID=A0A1W0CA02_9NEIS|nr:type VI secretion system lipoprotein TssJ [Chromobacterium haemolyticum]OQS31541.1 type VI secretion system-associated lipoprotein [Chromobacterium haemolyticum]